MEKALFLMQSHKFTPDSIDVTLACSKCDEVFTKEFPLDLEGQTTEFKCPVCNYTGEADIPFKPVEEREEIEEDSTEPEQESIADLNESY